MTGKLQLGVIFGGRSGEHEVSLMSAHSAIEALDKSKYEVIQIGITREGKWLSGPDVLAALESGQTNQLDSVTVLAEPGLNSVFRITENQVLEILAKVDVVFPILHGTYGEDGSLQGLLELADIPYIGAGVLASSVAMDKGLFKAVMQANWIPTADYTILLSSLIRQNMEQAISQAEAVSPYPLFTKPANLGSSVGISKCVNHSDLIEGLIDAAQYDRRVLVERGLDAREIEVSILGNEKPEASMPGEIVPCEDFYSYSAKYIKEGSELLIPAPIDPETAEEARRMAIKAYEAIDGAGMARADFLLDRKSEKLYLNEINTIPGFTKISMYPKLWSASGIPYSELMDRLVDLALERHAQKKQLVRTYGDEG